MEIFKKIVSFFKKYYVVFLALFVLLSYGQLLGMHVWQDDNALFFKLANIEGRAGYLGLGPLGDGAYKYTAAPYIPIYGLFGFNTIAYFAFTLAIYIVATIFIYKIFAKIFGEKSGRIAGFLYGAGFIAADGYIRLFNSVITNISIILISLLLYYLWRYTNEKKLKWYFFSGVIFWAALEFARARTHYLIGAVFLWELIFNSFKKPFKSIYLSVVRLIPYFGVFYFYFVVGADERSGQIKIWISKIVSGNFSEMYSFVSSLSSIVFPSWITNSVFKFEEILSTLIGVHIPIIKLFGLGLIGLTGIILFKKSRKRNIVVAGTLLIGFFWSFIFENLFATAKLNLGYKEFSLTFLGGIVLILLTLVLFALKKHRTMYLFFVLWLLLNLAAYSAYNPSVFYESINRYLAHSLFALIGIWVIISLNFKKSYYLIIIWGVGNLIANVLYQNRVLEVRANPARNFYSQLKNYVPEVKKGDVFYFDVDDSARGYFNDAFSVAQMPETTAIAWRYGIDRYDIKLFTNFDDLQKAQNEDNLEPNQIHSFWYRELKLIDTSQILREYFEKGRKTGSVQFLETPTSLSTEIKLLENTATVNPITLSVSLIATPRQFSEEDFPIQTVNTINPISKNPTYKVLAFGYKQWKEDILRRAKYSVTSEWRDRTMGKVHDGDKTTYWQADRILFKNKNENLTIDLGQIENINRFVFINGFANNSPTDYVIETSLDNKNWNEAKRIKETKRLETQEFQTVFFPETKARFIRMVIHETLNSDAPTISEAWPVLSKFVELDITETENYLSNPFSYLSNTEDYKNVLALSRYTGLAQVDWLKDNSGRWQSSEKSKLEILYDGKEHLYEITIPAGGLSLNGVRITNYTIPGEIKINSIQVR